MPNDNGGRLSPNQGSPHVARPLVSVCIANYDGELLLRECIDSVLRQDSNVEIEIIVHDDASRDGSIALLEASFSQIRLLRSDSNVGFCIANNRMVAAARGDFILLLNNDAALFPDAVRTLLETWNTVGNAILTLPQYDWEDGELVSFGNRLDVFYNVVPVRQPGRPALATVDGACLFMEKSLWDKLGGFPEFFSSIAEDAFLCCAARLTGARVVCTASSGYRHRQGATFGGNRVAGTRLSSRYRRRYLSERNRIALLVGCTPTWLVWPWLVAHLALLMIEALLLRLLMRSRDSWGKIYVPAARDAWRRRGATRRLRKMVQAHRRIGLMQYLKAFAFVPQRLRLLVRHGLPRLSD